MLDADGDLASKLLDYCRRAFGPGRNPRVCDLARIGDGWECEVFSFVLEGEQDGEPRRESLILRVYQGDDASRKAAREFAAMRLLHDAGYPVPRLLALASEDSPLGKPFVIMEKIDGPVLGRVVEKSTGERQRGLLSTFSELLVDLHALDWRLFAPDASRYRPEGFLDRWLLEAQTVVHRLRRSEFGPAVEWLKGRSGGICCRPSPTHRDFHPWNVLMRPDGALFVIDWTQADVSDFRFDLGWTLMLMRTAMGMSTRDLVLREYERHAGCRVEQVEYFEVLASLKRLVSIVVSISDGPEKLGMRPGAEAQMKAHVAHIATPYAVVREQTGLTISSVERLLSGLA